jgi:LasA protease
MNDFIHQRSSHTLVLLIVLLGLVLPGLVSSIATEVHAKPGEIQNANIEKAVIKAITKLKGAPPAHGTFVDVKRISEDSAWAFGSLALLTPKKEKPKDEAEAHLYDEVPEGRLWLARQTNNGWEAAIDYTPVFDNWLKEAPRSVVSTKEKEILGSAGPESSSDDVTTADALSSSSSDEVVEAASIPDSKLSLPWAPGQRWRFSSGPHGWTGMARPWSSLDFAKGEGDGRVLAARDGFVYRPCGNTTWVQVRHGDGWVTDYYHLTNIPLYPEGSWIGHGTYLGNIGTAVDCGGGAYGDHVHFNIKYNGSHIAWHGQKLGDWTIYEGAQAYEGYAQRGDERVYPGQLMTNYDVPQRVYDGANAAVVYVGSWRHESNVANTSWNTLSSSSVAGSKARFSFTGRRISLLYSMIPNGGSSDIYINGVYKDTISHRAAETRRQVIKTWELGYGSYTIEVRVKGGGFSDVDAFAVNLEPVGPGSYDNTHSHLRYIGYWQHVDQTSTKYNVSEAYNGTLSWSATNDSVMRFTFVGDRITYVYSN